MFFATALCILGYLRKGGDGRDEVARRSVTHARWARNGDARPVTYDFIDEALVQQIRF